MHYARQLFLTAILLATLQAASAEPLQLSAGGAHVAVTVRQAAVHLNGKAKPLAPTVRPDGQVARYERVVTKGDRGEIVLLLRGADRMIYGDGGQFGVRRVAGDSKALILTGRRAAFQSRANQSGVVLNIVGRAVSGDIHLTPSAEGVTIRIPFHGPDSSGGQTVGVVLQAFRGDAIIALEDMPAPAAASDGRTAVGAALVPLAPTNGASAATRAAALKAAEQQGTTDWLFFTGSHRAFQPLLADPQEAGVRLGWMADTRNGQKYLDAGIGGDLTILQRRFAQNDSFLTINARGLVIGRLNTNQDNFPLQATDFYFGLAGGYAWGDNAVELYAYHESSHLGDEVLDFGQQSRIDYSREAIRLLYSRRFGNLRLYGGPTINVHADPRAIQGKLILQAGGEYRFDAWGVPSYAALDLQSKQENDWTVNINAQVGVELGNPDRPGSKPRVYLEFFHGHNEFGQLWQDLDTHVMIGLGYNFDWPTLRP